MPERLEQGLTQPRWSIDCRNGFHGCQPAVDPADDVAISQIAQEQVEAVRGLVQPSVAQIMSRQGAIGPMLGVMPVDPNAPILAPALKEVAPGHLVAEFDPPAEAA